MIKLFLPISCNLFTFTPIITAYLQLSRRRKERMKKYNNIQDVSISNLYRMLEMDRFQDSASQKMIKTELSFRQNGMSFDEMTNVFKGNQ